MNKKKGAIIMNSVALMIYGDSNSDRNALLEEKYKDLAGAFLSNGFNVESVLYNDESAGKLSGELLRYDAILVWVNPIEKGHDRKKLDQLLVELSNKGCFVSTHPDVISKMGTKDVLYKTKDMDWGGDIKKYTNYDDFIRHFPGSLQKSKTRVLKQYRGNGGNGVFKVKVGSNDSELKVTHATEGTNERVLSTNDFNKEFENFFLNNGLLIDQE